MNNTFSRTDAEQLGLLQLRLYDYMRRMADSIKRIREALDNSNWQDNQRKKLEDRLKELNLNKVFMDLNINRKYLQELRKKVDLYNNK